MKALWALIDYSYKMTDKNSIHCNNPPSNIQITFILLISGFSGFCLGVFGYPMWQVAVEPAQIIAGLVQYPQQNPNYIYQAKLWTILHQIGALFLYIGISEKTLSYFIGGITGMISYQALALLVFCLSRDYLITTISPFMVHLMLNNNMLRGVNYPIMLMGSIHTYGMIGLSFILLVIALISVGNYKLGCLLLGISPSIHPSLGLWLNFIVLICLLWDFQYLRNVFKKVIHYLWVGYLISAISLIFHITTTYDVSDMVSSNASKYFYALVRDWDDHRQPFSLYQNKNLLIIAGLIMSLSSLMNQDMPRNSRLFFHSLIVSAITGGVCSIIYWFPPERFPTVFLTLMPSRLLNFNVIGSVILLLAVFGYYRDKFWIQFNMTILAIMLLLNPLSNYQFIMLYLSMSSLLIPWLINYLQPHQMAIYIVEGIFLILWGFWLLSYESSNLILRERYTSVKLLASSAFIFCGVFILILSLSSDVRRLFEKLFMRFYRISFQKLLLKKIVWLRIMRVSTLVVFTLVTLSTISTAYSEGKARRNVFYDRTNDSLFAEVSKREGMLLTCSNMHLIQLRTRRPVLLDGGGLNGIAYTPVAGPEMNRILKRIYGIDFLNPPKDIKESRRGELLRETGKLLWEARTQEQWDKISREFGITNILCYSDWKLQLPEIIRNNNFVLYSINE